MAVSRSFEVVRENQELNLNFLRNITRVVNNIMRGKTNNTGEVTLTASASSTVVTDPFVGGDSTIQLIPTTANAALEASSGALYISAVGDQTFTVSHSSSSHIDKTFKYVVIG